MNYYNRHIGDYHKKAARLSILQHGIYTLLMDAIYDRERFPTKEEAADWLWCSSKEELEALDFVLMKFFSEVDGVFIQQRIKDELESYKEKCEKNSQIAKVREAKRKEKSTKRDADSTKRAPVVNESPPNQEPITNNQEPITSLKDSAVASLPCTKGEIYFIQQSDIDTWSEAYPAVDIIQELRKIYAWLSANPSKLKTLKGCSRFVNNWLSRTQDQGGNKSMQASKGNTTQEQDFISLHTDSSWAEGL